MTQTVKAILEDNSLTAWITAGVVLIVGALIVTLLRRRSIVLAFFRKRVEGGDSIIAPFLVDQYLHTLIPVLYAAVFYAALSTLELTPGLRHGLNLLQGAIILYAIVRLIAALAVFFLERHVNARETERAGSGRSVHALVPIVQVAIWGVGIVFLLENFGFHVEAIVTGLGIGGVAVALAAQSLLKDVFGYVAIVTDRPFEIGDVIQTDTFIGTVEYIGLKTTHLRSLGGEQIIFANSDLTSARVRNWKRMTERRIVFTFAVSSETPIERIEEIPAIVRVAVEAQPEARFDRAHFITFADTGLTFEVVYYVLSAEYAVYLDQQQGINLALKRAFDQRSIKFATPTQTFVLREPSAAASDAPPEEAVAAGFGAAAAVRGARPAAAPGSGSGEG